MLKVNHSDVEVKGTKIVLMAELTTLIHELVKEEIFSQTDIDTCMETAKLSDEELDKRTHDNLSKLFDSEDMAKLLRAVFLD